MAMKQAYEDKMNARLRELRAKINVLKAKADQAEAEQKIKYYEEIESLRTRQQELHEKLDELRSAGEGAWEDIKAGVESAWRDLQAAFERAAERFK